MKTSTLCVLLAVVLFAAVGPAMANLGQADLTFPGYITDSTIKVYGDGFAGGVTGYGGIYLINVANASGEAADLLNQVTGYPARNGAFAAFCMELPQEPVNATYEVVMPEQAPLPALYGTPMDTDKADDLRELWGRHFDAAWVTGVPTSAEKKAAEAFSAAVWEIIYENELDWDVTTRDDSNPSNSFKASNVNTTLANAMLDSINGEGPMANLRAFTNAQGQDMLVEIVPAPGAAMLVFLGMGLIGWARRRVA